MDKLDLLLFSIIRQLLKDHTGHLRSILDDKGAEYDGPMPLPVFDSGIPLRKVEDIKPKQWSNDPPGWVVEIDESSVDRSSLTSVDQNIELDDRFNLYARKFTIYNEKPIKLALSTECPNGICLTANVDTVAIHANGDNVPAGYDPNQDNQPHP